MSQVKWFVKTTTKKKKNTETDQLIMARAQSYWQSPDDLPLIRMITTVWVWVCMWACFPLLIHICYLANVDSKWFWERERWWLGVCVGGAFSIQTHCRFVVTCSQTDKVAFPDCSHPRLSYLTPRPKKKKKKYGYGGSRETRHHSLIPVRRWLLIRSG